MNVRPDRLPGLLERGLAPAYLVAGDEPLPVIEAADAIRGAARLAGFDERVVHHVDRHFDWQRLADSGASLSLFSSRKLIELRLSSAKLGKSGGEALGAFAGDMPPDTLLLVIAPKLDRSAQATRWYKALDRVGVIVPVWPVAESEFPAWLAERLRRRGFQPERDAVLALAARVEGNLLAAQQEIDKLWLVRGGGALSVADIDAGVGDSARFSVFKLADCAVAGQSTRALRMLQSLNREGVEPILIAWALTREIRSLVGMRRLLDSGRDMAGVLKAGRVWSSRQGPVRSALSRHTSESLENLLTDCEALDAAVKGRGRHRPWDAALAVTIGLARRGPHLAEAG